MCNGRGRSPDPKKAGCGGTAAGLFLVPVTCYWMTEIVPPAVKGWVGAAAPALATSCQIAPAWLVANARLPVEAGLVGIAVE